MINCVSIFSGAGGLDVGAIKAGAKIVACVENDSDAAETLRLNKIGDGKSSIIETDIQNVDFRQMRSKKPTILIGGPPCQPFSKNGYWVRNNNRLIEGDPRNLIGQYLRTVDELRPIGFLFENVESILHPTNIATFERFLAKARALGFACTVFKPHVGVGELIKKYASSQFHEPQEDASEGTYFYELTRVPPGKNYIALSKLKNYRGRKFRTGQRFWNFLQKLHPDEPSITIAAQPGPWVGPFHWANRKHTNTNKANSQRCSILTVLPAGETRISATKLHRWSASERSTLLSSVPRFYDVTDYDLDDQFPRPATEFVGRYLRSDPKSKAFASLLSTVPKATVHKDRCLARTKHEVWPTRQLRIVQSVPQAVPVNKSANTKLCLGVLARSCRHHPASLRSADFSFH